MRNIVLLLIMLAGAAEPVVEERDLPRMAAVEAKDALGTFVVKEGFRVELAAAEPLVVDPVAMAFDEEGRLFVVEMRDYSERREEKLGRIRMLVDTDGDGKFDKATVYAEGLAWPTAVICWDGGVFVGATPDIIYFKDTDGDGVADEKKIAFTGFGSGVTRLNVQQLLNSFTWGLDNRIHGASGGNGGVINSPQNARGMPLDFRGKDFAFNPRTMEIRAEMGGGQHGLSFDDAGRKFVCSNSHHIQAVMYEMRYSGGNANYAMPGALVDIAADGPAAEVYRISPEEPWRVIRTKWRVSGLAPGPIEGGGRSAGYFTGATGVTIYRGDAWGKEFVGDAFIGDAGGNLVHRKKVRAEGVGLVASRPGDEEKREFLASKDTWFRPVQFANGPDGNLYICDMYRETIEHPWSLPESIKKHLDLNSGNDRGRIYRIVREGFKQPARVRMGEMRTGELVGMLESGNGWTRDTAARLIYERQDKWAIGGLRKLVKESGSALGRMHGLYALEGLGGLEAGLVEGALEDESALVRRQALRVSERFADNPQIVSAIAPKLARLVNDPDAWVRYQLAFTLGDFSFGDRNELLAELAKHDAGSAWARAAILSSLTKGSGEIFAGLMRDGVFRSSREGREILQQLVVLIGAGGRADDISQLRLALAGTEDRGLVFSLARGLGEGLGRHGESLGSIAELKPILADAAQAAMDPRVDEATRVQAIELLGLCVDRNSIEGLFKLHESKSARLQTAALAALDRRNPPGLAEVLIGRWRSLTLRARSEVMGVLLKREDRCRALLRGIAAGTIAREELSSTEIRYLREYPAGSVAEPARQLFVRGIDQSRKDVVDAMMPALEMKGDGELGKKIFLERCASCHRVGEEGFALGPDLVTVKNSGKEKLLVNIVDPNREVASQYSAYLVETKEGESVLGIIGSETATSVTLRQAYGVETVIFRSNIKRLKNQGQSLMPEGLEEGLGKQGVADLVEFILK